MAEYLNILSVHLNLNALKAQMDIARITEKIILLSFHAGMHALLI